MKIGVTGSRHPRPDHIIAELRQLLIEKNATELHHGDCIGFDAQAHDAAVALGIKTIAHPPAHEAARAFKDADDTRMVRGYLDRNKVIVSEADFLIAAPDGPEVIRSGTWSTVRHARRTGVPHTVLTEQEADT